LCFLYHNDKTKTLLLPFKKLLCNA
jgi:hypothetical protein